MPTAGSQIVTSLRGQPVALVEQRWVAQRLVHQPHHRVDHLGRRVIGAGLLAQVVVVDFQKVLVEVEPRVRVALGHVLPIDDVEHAAQRVERGLQAPS